MDEKSFGEAVNTNSACHSTEPSLVWMNKANDLYTLGSSKFGSTLFCAIKADS